MAKMSLFGGSSSAFSNLSSSVAYATSGFAKATTARFPILGCAGNGRTLLIGAATLAGVSATVVGGYYLWKRVHAPIAVPSEEDVRAISETNISTESDSDLSLSSNSGSQYDADDEFDAHDGEFEVHAGDVGYEVELEDIEEEEG